MKVLLFALMLFGCLPLFGKEKPQAPQQPEKPKFVPLLPDSLKPKDLNPFLHPERDPQFQKQHGVILVPNPSKVEPNPGGLIEADPTVDLGIIYPLETRHRIMLKNKTKASPADTLKPKLDLKKKPDIRLRLR